MELPSTGEMAALFAVFWFGMIVWLGIRTFRASSEQRLVREAVVREIARRAAARGRRFTPGSGDLDWTVDGRLPAGESWSLRSITTTTSVGGASRSHVKNFISGQLLTWQAPSIRRAHPVLRFERRTGEKPPDEVNLEGNEGLWRRWRIVSGDAMLAQRLFDAPVCALLEKLPPRFASNTYEDERTSITLRPEGLVFERGVYQPDADQVDLQIAIGEALAERARGGESPST